MSLIGQLPLAAISISCKNIEASRNFYADVIGLRIIDEEDSQDPASSKSGSIHFDLGNIRLSLVSRSPSSSSTKSEEGGTSGKLGASDHLVFVVENDIEVVCADLGKRGVKFRSKKILEDTTGKVAWFNDPDGRVIYLWQPLRRESKNFKDVELLVRHYESVSRTLADLREEEIAV